MKYTPSEALKTLYDGTVERMYRGNTQNNTSVNDIDGNSYTIENWYVLGVDLAESEYYSQILYLYKLTESRFWMKLKFSGENSENNVRNIRLRMILAHWRNV